jgi:hypothetical protein
MVYFKDGKMTLKFSMADRLPEHKGCKSLFFKTIAGYIALISKFLWTSLNPDENQVKHPFNCMKTGKWYRSVKRRTV